MKYRSLLKVAIITIAISILFMVVFFVYIHRGKKLEEKLAGVICAKLINDYIDSDFKIDKVSYNESYKFNQSKINLIVIYSNSKKYISNCYYKSRYFNSEVSLIRAELKGKNGRLKILSDLKIRYKK